MKRKILLVEDNYDTADSLIRACEIRGIDVVLVRTVPEAHDAYEVDGFDVIVVDYELPGGTGLDFIAKIRGSDKARVVLHSGLSRSKEIEASGMDVEQVSKSDPFALMDIIEGKA